MLNLPETKSLIILNILGEKLLDVKISPSNTSTAVFKINTSSIPAGNYLIGIEGEDRQTFQKFSILR
jgi:hypothetical protein